MNDFVTIKNDVLEVNIHPELGGSIFSFKYNLCGKWVDILRPTPIEAVEEKTPGRFSSFSLIPYSNFLEKGILKFEGKEYRLYNNSEQEHRTHGEVRLKPCKVEQCLENKLVLSFDSRDFEDIYWPFPFTVIQEYLLDKNKFTMKMSMKNAGLSNMPGGLGIHPYFCRFLDGKKGDVFVRIPLKGIYPDENQIPTGKWIEHPDCVEFSMGKVLSGEPLDKCYRANEGTIYIKWLESNLTTAISSSEIFDHTVIYCPENDDRYFAVEPVQHCNNAFNMHEAGIDDTGTVILRPEEETAGSIKIEILENSGV